MKAVDEGLFFVGRVCPTCLVGLQRRGPSISSSRLQECCLNAMPMTDCPDTKNVSQLTFAASIMPYHRILGLHSYGPHSHAQRTHQRHKSLSSSTSIPSNTPAYLRLLWSILPATIPPTTQSSVFVLFRLAVRSTTHIWSLKEKRTEVFLCI